MFILSYHSLALCYAEASCASQIKTAKAVSQEFGEAKASQSGISQWAKIQDKNSERDVQRLVKKQRTVLNVRITELNIQGQHLPWISPKDWLRYILTHGLLYMLSGLQLDQRHLIGRTWKEFWTRYEILHPSFELFFMDGINFETTIGLYIHGDEGRTLKRGGLMVTSLQSVLGNGFGSRRRKRPRDQDRLQINFAGHTYLTRFVTSVMAKTHYQSNPDFFHDTMEAMALELKDLLVTGLKDPHSDNVYKFCVIGIKGDMPYLQKVGRLKRSWNTGVKRGTERTQPKGVCHLCLAGTTNFPCEDTSTQPVWAPTVGLRVPWEVTPVFVLHLPKDRENPADYFKPDLWHCVHLGVGKSFIASSLQLALETVPGSNNDDRFEWLTNHYTRWCRSMKRCCYISKISAYIVSYGDSAGATGNWSKGAVTTSLMLWLVKLLGDIAADQHGFLARCKAAAKSMNAALAFLYQAPLFLEEDECRFVVARGMFFL